MCIKHVEVKIKKLIYFDCINLFNIYFFSLFALKDNLLFILKKMKPLLKQRIVKKRVLMKKCDFISQNSICNIATGKRQHFFKLKRALVCFIVTGELSSYNRLIKLTSCFEIFSQNLCLHITRMFHNSGLCSLS